MADAILVLNAGSSSLKFALFEAGSAAADQDSELMLRGQIEGIGRAPEFRMEAGSRLAADAKLAVDVFCYRLSRELGSLAAALGGFQALVFRGGIGAHANPVSAEVCRGAAWLGVAARGGRERAPRPPYHQRAKPGQGLGDPDQRGISHRPPHARLAALQPK